MNIAGTIRDDFSTVQIRGSCFGNEKKKVLQLQRTNTTGEEEKKRKQAFAPTENRKMHRKARYCGPFRKIDRSHEHFQNDRCTVPVCRFLFPK